MFWIIDWLDIFLGDGIFIVVVEFIFLFGIGILLYRVFVLFIRGGCNKIIYVVYGDMFERYVIWERCDICERYVICERYDICERFC